MSEQIPLDPDPAGPGTAVVTGASSGIGAEYARALAGRGHPLVLVARRADRLTDLAHQVARETGVAVETLPADLADPSGLAAVAERVAAEDVSVLVNNAGIGGYGPFAEVPPQTVRRVVDLNVTAPTVLARSAVPGLVERGRGAVVNVASMLAFSAGSTEGGLPVRTTYAGTKSYLVVFTRLLARELAGTGVQAQVVCPGFTATEFHDVRGGEPFHGRPATPGGMPATEVVAASLVALDAGEVVCVPGLDDPTLLDGLVAAERDLRAGTGGRLAPRYGGVRS